MAPMREKKSETLEIRLPHALKQAFMARCRADGDSASAVLRDFIERHVAQRPRRRPPIRLIAAGAALLAVGAVAAPSLARPSLPAQFARLDADGDGRLSLAEFSGAASLRVQVSLRGATHIEAPDAQTRALVLRAEFRRIDLNGDGELSFDEFRRRYGR